MKRITLIAALLLAMAAVAQESSMIVLPPPQRDGGKPLMQCLSERHSTREYAETPLAPQTLSNLLWAAFGVNREDERRTAPSAMNRQEMDIYVATADGVFLYEPKTHALQPALTGDHRAATGGQDFVGKAAVNLVYVADYEKMGESSEEDKLRYSSADAGFIAENVYLFCASEGLATVVRGWVDRDALAKTLNLRSAQKIVLAQTVGHPQ